MGAYTFLLQLFPTTTTTILIPNVPMDFLRKNQHKKGKEQITDINMCHQDKEEIAENTARHQPQQIKDSCSGSQLSKQIIQHRQSDYQKQPNTQQEDRENKRNFERRQSRIEIKMLPRFRHKDLHRFVNRCTESHQQTEK